MLCTCIYFVDIGSFDGETMSEPPHNPGVDLDDDQKMAYAEDHGQEASGERHAPHAGASVPPFARRGRLDTRYMMELGDQLSALIVEVGIRPVYYRDIQTDDRILQMGRGMLRDMYSLMRHVVGATIAVTRLRRIVRSYRRSQAVACDRQSADRKSVV